MDANEYQRLALRTLITKVERPLGRGRAGIVYALIQKGVDLGFAFETLKKGFFHGHEDAAERVEHYRDWWGVASDHPDLGDRDLTENEYFVVWNLIGLFGEVGELGHLVLRRYLWKLDVDNSEFEKELGDVCWYVAMLARRLGFDLDAVMRANIEKLAKRYPTGFSTEASIERRDIV